MHYRLLRLQIRMAWVDNGGRRGSLLTQLSVPFSIGAPGPCIRVQTGDSHTLYISVVGGQDDTVAWMRWVVWRPPRHPSDSIIRPPLHLPCMAPWPEKIIPQVTSLTLP